jgi:hypothetical protein
MFMQELTVDQQHQKLIVEVVDIERLWVHNSHFEIPLAHVKGASLNPEVANDLPYPSQLPGDPQLHSPVSAGTFYKHGKRVFWEVSDPAQAVVIELKDDEYAELVVQVENPEAMVSQINQAIGAQS